VTPGGPNVTPGGPNVPATNGLDHISVKPQVNPMNSSEKQAVNSRTGPDSSKLSN
jgi:hypothetical protein